MTRDLYQPNREIVSLVSETPTEYAERLGRQYTLQVSELHKKHLGQFFTPSSIAQYMASLCTIDKENIKILDPGCGIGILSTALIENLLILGNNLKTIELTAFEIDINILPLAESCFKYLGSWLNTRGINFKFFLCKNDFILHNSLLLNNLDNTHEDYDIVISNPPYFKLPKNDERAFAARTIIFGQTNIYTIFLIIAAKLLKEEGQLIFITPRSFCSGSYFRLFREIFFSIIDLRTIHLFKSRKEAFKEDNVLQENIIISATKKTELNINENDILISHSKGVEDIIKRRGKRYKMSDLVNFGSYQKILHLPSSEIDEKVIEIFKTWTGSLKSYGLEISTGPVVDFRSADMIKFDNSKKVVPLIWMHNIESMKFLWPRINGYKGKPKGQYILNNDDSKSRLVTNRNYVLLRRFSTKDDNRRLIAAPYFSRYISKIDKIGIENHLNYIYHKETELTKEETFGLAAMLNSRLFDLYFRTFNGNINVSATELRDFPLPSFKMIQLLGEEISMLNEKNLAYDIDTLVLKTFNLSNDLF